MKNGLVYLIGIVLFMIFQEENNNIALVDLLNSVYYIYDITNNDCSHVINIKNIKFNSKEIVDDTNKGNSIMIWKHNDIYKGIMREGSFVLEKIATNILDANNRMIFTSEEGLFIFAGNHLYINKDKAKNRRLLAKTEVEYY